MEPNLLLDALLDEAGMSYAGFASRLNQGRSTRYDHSSVHRWIRDHGIPRGDTPNLICDVLGERLGRSLTLADIGMDRVAAMHQTDHSLESALAHATALWRGDHRRSEVVEKTRLLRGAAAVAPVFEWENPPDDPDVSHHGPRRVGRSDIDRVQHARARYEQMYRRVGGVPVRGRVVAYLTDQVAPLVRGSYDDRTGRELLRAAGGLVALAGISAYDSNMQPLAQRYLVHALRLAKASGSRSFGGYVVALLANQAMYRGAHRQVIQYAETALRGARGHLSPALTADLHALQAKAYARLGDTTGCHLHMEQSHVEIRPEEEPPETGYVQPGLVDTQHAEALRSLGDLRAAQEHAELALQASDVHTRGRVHRMATYAVILGQRREVDHAVEVGQQMFDLALGMESGRIADRVRTVAGALAHYDTPVVRDFREQASHLADVPR
ncbi:transcriptional regulator [Actinomadura harenae]|uniref:Transcriptional regulator n=1 Tax=Actinomadura harenae TaxID=2483351 RepID=A0A3M2LY03_9ACTN|nr:transcriptional regulator [Actinomadura harenae]RMI39858.1 transcriptional regulator [Actinomadura harenae]